MRVLLVTNDYPPRVGGIERYLSALVDHYPDEIRVLGPRADDPGSDPRVVRGHRGYLWPTATTRDWIGGQIEEFRPEVVVYGAPWPMATLGPGLARATGVPYGVLTYGADLTAPIAIPVVSDLVARPLRRAAVVMALSRFTCRRAERLTRRPVVDLGCGIDLDRFHPDGRSSSLPVVGCVGRFVERKGQDRVLRAAQVLWEEGYRLEVLLAGHGPTERRLRALASRLEVPVRFEVDLPAPRLPELYRQMDVFCMPVRSKWMGLEIEGLGIVYLEAAASGLPVLAGPSGGAPETIEPGVTGFLVSSEEHIVEALAHLLDHPERAREMGEAGRKRMEDRFSWDAVVARFQVGLRRAVEAPRE